MSRSARQIAAGPQTGNPPQAGPDCLPIRTSESPATSDLYAGHKKRTEPQKAPSAAKKQPICRGSGTAAGQSTLWKIIFSESLYSDTWKYQAITSSEEVSVSI